MSIVQQNLNYNQNKQNMQNLSNQEIANMMEGERMSLTCAPGGENNRGMEIIGRMPIKGEGFTANDIEGLGPYFEKLMPPEMDAEKHLCFPKVSVLDLNCLSLNDAVDELGDEDQARVLVLRDWAKGADVDIYKEIAPIRWDSEYLDPNKYRTEIVDGEEVKVRGKPMNKLARTNLCFVAGREQKPAVLEGKGTIYDLKRMAVLNAAIERLREDIAKGLIEIGSKTKVIINVVEGNRYYDLKKTGIGFHGDTERVVVICLSIGGVHYPMRWQWFKDGMPVGKPIEIFLNSGDVYVMSEKAVGADWKKSSLYTLRHAAGADKYRSLSKWDKRLPAYEARMKRKAEIKAERAAEKLTRQQAKADKASAKAATKTLDKAITVGNVKVRAPKTPCDPKKLYAKALKKHDWVDSDAGFYGWLAIEVEHKCSPRATQLKELYEIWSGKVENWETKMDSEVWEKHREFYRNLCAYGVFF